MTNDSQRDALINGFWHHGVHYTAEQLALVRNALASGAEYDSQLNAACREPWGALTPAADACVTGEHFEIVHGGLKEINERAETLRLQLLESPRGTWGLLVRPFKRHDGVEWREVRFLMSKGGGRIHDLPTTGLGDPEMLLPGFKHALKNAIEMELYLARNALRQLQLEEMSIKRIKDHGLRVGVTLHEIFDGTGSYSSGLIIGMNGRGTLELLLTRRGSKKRWKMVTPAVSIRARELAHTSAEMVFSLEAA